MNVSFQISRFPVSCVMGNHSKSGKSQQTAVQGWSIAIFVNLTDSALKTSLPRQKAETSTIRPTIWVVFSFSVYKIIMSLK